MFLFYFRATSRSVCFQKEECFRGDLQSRGGRGGWRLQGISSVLLLLFYKLLRHVPDNETSANNASSFRKRKVAWMTEEESSWLNKLHVDITINSIDAITPTAIRAMMPYWLNGCSNKQICSSRNHRISSRRSHRRHNVASPSIIRCRNGCDIFFQQRSLRKRALFTLVTSVELAKTDTSIVAA